MAAAVPVLAAGALYPPAAGLALAAGAGVGAAGLLGVLAPLAEALLEGAAAGVEALSPAFGLGVALAGAEGVAAAVAAAAAA